MFLLDFNIIKGLVSFQFIFCLLQCLEHGRNLIRFEWKKDLNVLNCYINHKSTKFVLDVCLMNFQLQIYLITLFIPTSTVDIYFQYIFCGSVPGSERNLGKNFILNNLQNRFKNKTKPPADFRYRSVVYIVEKYFATDPLL